MARTIHCQDCNKYLGEIRDAKLRKGIRHYCEDCDRRNRAARRLSEAAGQGRNPLGDMLAGIWN